MNILYQNDANVNVADKDGYTPLILAAHTGHTEIVNILYQNGANVDAAVNNGFNGLIVAAQNGHTEIVNIVVAKWCKCQCGR